MSSSSEEVLLLRGRGACLARRASGENHRRFRNAGWSCIFRAKAAGKFSLGALKLGRAERAVRSEKIAGPEPALYGTLDIAKRVGRIAAGRPPQRLFEEPDLAAQVAEEVIEEPERVVVCDMAEAQTEAAVLS